MKENQNPNPIPFKRRDVHHNSVKVTSKQTIFGCIVSSFSCRFSASSAGKRTIVFEAQIPNTNKPST